MAEAWQKRECEQQEFLGGLMHDAFEASEEWENTTRLYLMGAYQLLGAHLTHQGGLVPQGFHDHDTEGPFVSEWIRKASEKIKQFSRTKEEAEMLQTRLLEKLLELGLAYVHGAYLHQRVHEPERLYEGCQAMDEVPD